MTSYICRNCNYKFKSALDQKGRPCSYCGEKAITKEPNADELLKELE